MGIAEPFSSQIKDHTCEWNNMSFEMITLLFNIVIVVAASQGP